MSRFSGLLASEVSDHLVDFYDDILWNLGFHRLSIDYQGKCDVVIVI